MKEKECLQCGKTFKPRKKTSKYCSQECQWLSMTKRDLSTHICKVCGKEFTLNRTGLKGYYCSRECSYLDKENPMYDHSVQIDEANKRKKYRQELKEAKDECKQRLKEIDSQLKELSRLTECKVCEEYLKVIMVQSFAQMTVDVGIRIILDQQKELKRMVSRIIL